MPRTANCLMRSIVFDGAGRMPLPKWWGVNNDKSKHSQFGAYACVSIVEQWEGFPWWVGGGCMWRLLKIATNRALWVDLPES